MKRGLTALSLLLNLLFVALVVGRFLDQASRAGLPPEERVTTAPMSTDGFARDGAGSEPSPPASSSAFSWEQLDRSNWFSYRDGLLRLGCPKRTVREIIEPLLDRERWAKMRHYFDTFDQQFWKLIADESHDSINQWIGNGKKTIEEYQALKESLFAGFPSLEDPVATEQGTRAQFAFLPTELADRAADVWSQYLEQKKTISRDHPNRPQDWAPLLQQAREQRDAALRSFLSPAQFSELILRIEAVSESGATQGLWDALSLSRDELIALHEIKDRYRVEPGFPVMAESERNKQAEIQQLVGPTKAAELERASDPTFQSSVKLVTRLDLPIAIAGQLQSLQVDATRRAEGLRKDSNLFPSEPQAQLNDLKQTTIQRATTILGTDRGRLTWERYVREWLTTTFQPNFPEIMTPILADEP